MGESGGDKSEEPTPHKLREARKKGQVAKSKEFTSAVLVITSFMVFKNVALKVWLTLGDFARFMFEQIPNEFSRDLVGEVMFVSVNVFILAVGPIFLVTVVVAAVVEIFQTRGLLFTTHPIQPNLSKLNPLEGFKRIFFSLKGLVELIKSLIKIFIVVWIMYSVIKEELPLIVSTCNLHLWDTMKFTASIVYKAALRVGLFYIVIALFDYIYQRYEYLKGLRMTKQEVKEEYKRLEGDPMVKQRLRTAQREMAQRRMMGAVPGADVVVTNPVHLAVVIKYDVSIMRAPQVVAKGMRLIAQRIKALAEENKVPVIENQGLAQTLYRTTDIGQEISLELYKAVAELLAFVYNLEKKRKSRH